MSMLISFKDQEILQSLTPEQIKAFKDNFEITESSNPIPHIVVYKNMRNNQVPQSLVDKFGGNPTLIEMFCYTDKEFKDWIDGLVNDSKNRAEQRGTPIPKIQLFAADDIIDMTDDSNPNLQSSENEINKSTNGVSQYDQDIEIDRKFAELRKAIQL